MDKKILNQEIEEIERKEREIQSIQQIIIEDDD